MMEEFWNYLYFLTTVIALAFIGKHVCEVFIVKYRNQKEEKEERKETIDEIL